MRTLEQKPKTDAEIAELKALAIQRQAAAEFFYLRMSKALLAYSASLRQPHDY